MRNSKKNILFNLSVFGVIVVTIISYVVLKLEIQRIDKDKLKIDEEYKAKFESKQNLLAEVQKLQSEERIVPIVMQQLKLVKKPEENQILVNTEEIEKLSKLVEKKYE